MKTATLALADGSIFKGRSFGSGTESVGEVVFNTSMYGYQEILTDPSYVQQMVTMAYPHMGNVGTNADDEESQKPHATGMIVKEYSESANWRSTLSLSDYLSKHQVGGIEGLDTRKLVRHLRTVGSQMGVLSTESMSDVALIEKAKKESSMEGRDLATLISTKTSYVFSEATPAVLPGDVKSTKSKRFKVVAVDYGLKKAMLRYLVDEGCEVTVVPSSSTAEHILSYKPHGVFLTNGPGDPAAVKGAREAVAQLLGKLPIFGICLGHQILALALGAKTYKMKFGHRGANQPVKVIETGRVEITSQNHGFAVDAKSLSSHVRVSHVNLNDGTIEGIEVPDARAFSVQHHPESSPGPHEARALFGKFISMMERS
jgi:carbamoyl-phosphate synthase small subunit